MRKYKKFRGRLMARWKWLHALQRRNPQLFNHWSLGPMAGWWEPDESRGSRPVLRARGAAMPRATQLRRGRLTTRQYEAKDGSGTRYRTDIVALQMRLLGNRTNGTPASKAEASNDIPFQPSPITESR
jgi:hypothetical protein